MDGDDRNGSSSGGGNEGNGSVGDGGDGMEMEGQRASSYLMEGYTPLGFDMSAIAAMEGNGSDGEDGNVADVEDGEMDGQLFASGYYHVMGAPSGGRMNGVKDRVLEPGMHHGYDERDASHYTDNSIDDNSQDGDGEGSVEVPDDFHRLAEQSLRGLEVERMTVVERSSMTPMDAVAPSAVEGTRIDNKDLVADAPTVGNAPGGEAGFEARFPNFDGGDDASDAPNVKHSDCPINSGNVTEDAVAPRQKKIVALPKVQLTRPKSKPMNVDAVQKAMQSIRLKSPQLATTLDAKTSHVATDAVLSSIINATSQAIEHSSQQQQLTAHAIIPSGPLAAFRRSTPKAQAASANLSRSATLSEAVHRLWPLICFRRRARGSGCSKSLTIHILGADGVECSSEETVRKAVGSFVRWLDSSLRSGALSRDSSHSAGIDSLLIQFSGPCMPTSLIGKVIDLLPQSKSDGSGLVSARATFQLREYHEAPSSTGDAAAVDIAIAFNAGIWGYDSWQISLAYMCAPKVNDKGGSTGTLFIITAYTVEECEDDADVVAEVVEKIASETFSSAEPYPIARQLWPPEPNPFRSRLERKTASAPPGRKYYENGAWQAWLLGL